jgi:hypothetical protein
MDDWMGDITAYRDAGAFARLFEVFAPKIKGHMMHRGADPRTLHTTDARDTVRGLASGRITGKQHRKFGDLEFRRGTKRKH